MVIQIAQLSGVRKSNGGRENTVGQSGKPTVNNYRSPARSKTAPYKRCCTRAGDGDP